MRAFLLSAFALGFAAPAFAADPPKDTPSAAQTRKKLAAKVTVDFKNEFLKDVIKEVSSQVEDQKLGPIIPHFGVGVSQNTRVTYAGKDVTAAEALDGIFKQLDLGYVVVSKANDRYDGWIDIAKGNLRGYPEGVTPPKGSEPAKTEPKTEPKVEPKPEVKPVENDPDEKMAALRLETAKKLIEENKGDDAKKLLRYVVKSFPMTKAAAEAKELLDKMK